MNRAEWDFRDAAIASSDAIEEIALGELKLDIYPNQIEVISSEQMLDAYSSLAMPLLYNHWSFGKLFAREETIYRAGYSALAYEIVINSNPCISYLLEENSMTMQALVIAHAAFGHNHFFKNNYLFQQWTNAESILEYLSFAKRYIARLRRALRPRRRGSGTRFRACADGSGRLPLSPPAEAFARDARWQSAGGAWNTKKTPITNCGAPCPPASSRPAAPPVSRGR